MEMLNAITLKLIFMVIYYVIYCGECFKYNNQTRDILCSTQCRAACLENESDCEYGCSPPFRYWIAMCENCSGTCDRRSRTFNSTLLPAVPSIYVESIQGSRIVLQWIQPFSRTKILYVLQMRKDGDPDWQTVAYEIQLTRYVKEIEDPCYGYYFRVMAVNMYGSNGFSENIYAHPNQPGPVPNISFVGGAVYYSPGSDEFMAIIQWDDPENWPKSDVSLFAWDTIPSFYCERGMVNILPMFEEINVNRTHQQHHKVLFRVSRDAYGCRYENQVRAISKCGIRGVGTNFTVDLTDCNQIKNFPCEAISSTTVDPGNAVNISLCVLYQHPNILIRLSWEPPVQLGTFGVDHYIIRWGKVLLNPFPLLPTFINNHPNVTTVPSIAREIDVPVDYNDQSSIFGFQVVPVSYNQHIADKEWGLYNYSTIKISNGGDDRQVGTVLLDESGLRVVQIQNALEVDLSLQPLTRTRWASPTTSQRRCSDSLDYALQFGRILQTSPPVFSHYRSLHLLSNVTNLKLPLIEASEELQYGIRIMHVTKNENISDIEWDDIPVHVFHVPPTTVKANDNSQVEKIVGIVVAGIMLLCIVFGVVIWRRVKQRNKLYYLERQNAIEESNPYYHIHRGLRTGSILTPAIVADRWELPHSCVKVGRVLGHGAFGLVLKGRVSSDMIRNSHARVPKEAFVAGNQICVAIKVLQENVQEQYKCDFLKEINLMKDIGFHKNVLSMLGCCTLRDPICLVVEHVPHGDLLSYLQNIRQDIQQRDHNQQSYVNRDVDLLSPTDILSFARQVAVGMEFLSQKGYVHRDLAARNVLVGYNKTIKIGDFGLTRYIYNDVIYVNRKGGKLPLKWMSIEAILQLTFSVASDIWAFGVVLFEMVTLGGTPYPGINTADILPMLRQGYRMERPDNCSEELYGVMLSCWQELPELRPSFMDLCSVLGDMLQENSDLEYLNMKIDVNHQYYTINSDEMDQDEVTALSDAGGVVSAAKTNMSEDINTIKGEQNVPKNIENHSVANSVSGLHGKRTARSYMSGKVEEHSPFKGNNVTSKNYEGVTFKSHDLYSSSDNDAMLPSTITFDAEVEKQICQCKTDSGLFIVSRSTESDAVSVQTSGEKTQESIFGNPFLSLGRQQRDSGLDSGSSNDEGSLASSSPKTISSRCRHMESFSNAEDNVFMSDDFDQNTEAFHGGNFIFDINSETISSEVCDMCKYYNHHNKFQSIDDNSIRKRKCHIVGSMSDQEIETEIGLNRKQFKTNRGFNHTEVQDWPYEDINVIDTYF